MKPPRSILSTARSLHSFGVCVLSLAICLVQYFTISSHDIHFCSDAPSSSLMPQLAHIADISLLLFVSVLIIIIYMSNICNKVFKLINSPESTERYVVVKCCCYIMM